MIFVSIKTGLRASYLKFNPLVTGQKYHVHIHVILSSVQYTSLLISHTHVVFGLETYHAFSFSNKVVQENLDMNDDSRNYSSPDDLLLLQGDAISCHFRPSVHASACLSLSRRPAFLSLSYTSSFKRPPRSFFFH